MSRAQVAADLRAAAEVLRRDGWTQGDLGNPGECRCLIGAMDAVVSPERSEAVQDMWDRFAEVVGTQAIVAWNDTLGRTADEVIAALEAAADAAEAQS